MNLFRVTRDCFSNSIEPADLSNQQLAKTSPRPTLIA